MRDIWDDSPRNQIGRNNRAHEPEPARPAQDHRRFFIMTDSDMSALRARADNGNTTASDQLIELTAE